MVLQQAMTTTYTAVTHVGNSFIFVWQSIGFYETGTASSSSSASVPPFLVFDLLRCSCLPLRGASRCCVRSADFIGVLILAFVSGLGGGLIRDAIFIQSGPHKGQRFEIIPIVVLVAFSVIHGVSRRWIACAVRPSKSMRRPRRLWRYELPGVLRR